VQRHDLVPELDHRRRQLEQVLLLPADHLLPALHEDLDRMDAELVEQKADSPEVGGQLGGVLGPGDQPVEHRLLQREDEGRGLGRSEAETRARARHVGEQRLRLAPGGTGDVVLA